MDNKVVQKMQEEIKAGRGKVYTKTPEQLEMDRAELAEKQRKAFLSAAVLLAATYDALMDLEELGAAKLTTKHTFLKARQLAEKDINTIFNLADKGDLSGAVFIDEGSKHISELLEKYVP
jgi:hypothetical protein